MKFTKPQWTPRATKRITPLRAVIDVSAFAGVMLALVFLFMSGFAVVTHPRNGPADLPQSSHSAPMPKALREDALVITIARDGSVYFRDLRILKGNLPDMIREGLRNGAENTVYIKADARAQYGAVKAVLDQVRLSGVQNINFITEQPYRPSSYTSKQPPL